MFGHLIFDVVPVGLLTFETLSTLQALVPKYSFWRITIFYTNYLFATRTQMLANLDIFSCVEMHYFRKRAKFTHDVGTDWNQQLSV